MAHVVDFHFHSMFSDGIAMPDHMVAAAKADNPAVTHLAMSDHDTFLGCPTFLDACRAHGIEGFVSAEIGGSHPDFPHIEFHILANFGPEWNASVARRTALFHPYWNTLRRLDHENIFRFINAASQMGISLSFRDVARKSVEAFHAMPEPKDLGIIQPVKFGHLRMLLQQMGLETRRYNEPDNFEKSVWRKAGMTPLPSPFITEAYPLFRQAKPAVTLAHPMCYAWTLEQARPIVERWKHEIGLIAVEAHYGGRLFPEWKALADELGLLVSAGSDSHADGYNGTQKATQQPLAVPVIDQDQCDMAALLDRFRAAGQV